MEIKTHENRRCENSFDMSHLVKDICPVRGTVKGLKAQFMKTRDNREDAEILKNDFSHKESNSHICNFRRSLKQKTINICLSLSKHVEIK